MLRVLVRIVLAAFIIVSTAIGHAADKTGPELNLSTAIMEVARQNIPAVVHIEVTQRQEVSVPFLPFQNDPFFRYFYDAPRMPRKFKEELKSVGSGIIMDSRGHILTNNHVVSGATGIQVMLTNGRGYPAEVVGTDPKTDLAVIRIAAKEPLPYVSFGDSDKIVVGEWVVAIGHPRGLDHTVTQGIISAKHRHEIVDPTSYQDFLQTDAAINPGNSGGPLLNLQGQVVGINAAIASESGGFEGIGFAIPGNMALYVARALIKDGKVVRGWIGVSIQDITYELARGIGLDIFKGAYIADLVKGGPAEQAGLRRGDVVVAYNGKPVANSSALRNEVSLSPVNQEAKLEVLRKNQRKEFTVKVGNQEVLIRMLTASVKDRLGVSLRPVTTQEAKQFGLNLQEGVAISWIDADGPLGTVGFEKGDILLEVQGQPIESMDSFVNLVSALPPDQNVVLLAIDHKTGQAGYVQVQIR
ncbi:MAG: trypsin-like peptidase domain-containing protein [Thermodesulfobacteriota bacterium]